MRLGDLDALKEEIEREKELNPYYALFYDKFIAVIDNAPTIIWCNQTSEGLPLFDLRERPKGEWIKEDDESLEGWYRCSKCGRRVEDLTDDVVIHAGCEDYTIADIYPYCHCGAKMRGE